MKTTRKDAGERIARDEYHWLPVDHPIVVKLQMKINRVTSRAVNDERESNLAIIEKWRKSAKSAGTPLGEGVVEHLEAIAEEIRTTKGK